MYLPGFFFLLLFMLVLIDINYCQVQKKINNVLYLSIFISTEVIVYHQVFKLKLFEDNQYPLQQSRKERNLQYCIEYQNLDVTAKKCKTNCLDY